MTCAKVRFTPKTVTEKPLFSARDVFLLGYLPALATIAWTLPETSWHAFCQQLAGIQTRVSGRVRHRANHIAHLLGEHFSVARAEEISRMLAANYHYSRLQILRMHRSKKWEPRKEVVGSEHLDHALKQGRGAVVWVAPFVFSDLMTKVALYRHGFRLVQLSRWEHGISASRIGARLLNPVVTGIEGRYISERLLITNESVLHELTRRLRKNQIVAVTAVTGAGQRTSTTPFFRGELQIAGGAAALARRSGAALLPVFTARNEDGTFVTSVEPPIQTFPDLAPHAAISKIAEQWAARLAPRLLNHPEQFLGWDFARRLSPAP